MRLLICLSLLLLFSCSDKTFVEKKVFVGGQKVTPEVLNHGKLAYIENCMPCHGEKGDGNGVAAKGMNPPPRDFTKGVFKFGLAPAGELPSDEDLVKIVKNGLHGTAMLPWKMYDGRINAIIQYIKTFAPQVWEAKDGEPGKTVELTKDPYGLAYRKQAIRLGMEVYHIQAQCTTCHRGYAGKDLLDKMSMKIENAPFESLDDEYYQVKLQEGEYEGLNLPPDFTWDPVRSADTVEELAYRIAAGVGGTTMPAWKDTVSDSEIWAVAYYVRYLMDFKDDINKRNNFLRSVRAYQ